MSARGDVHELRACAHAPWPLRRDGGFFDVRDGARRGRTTRHGEVFWEDPTYCDDRVLLALPRDFDARRPATLVLYLHGNRALLERDVLARQRVLAQVRAANINAALIAPQFARDAPDSSAGRFAVRGVCRALLDESAQGLRELCARRDGRAPPAATFDQAPLILVAYSGGYCPAAAALAVGRIRARVRGVVLLDALYDHAPVFAEWFACQRRRAFLLSAYTHGTRGGNLRLRALLGAAGLDYTLGLRPALGAGDACLVPLDGAVDHAEVVTRAWVHDPLTDVLRRAGPARRT